MASHMPWLGLVAVASACTGDAEPVPAPQPECSVQADCVQSTDTKCRYHYCGDSGTCNVRDVRCFPFPSFTNRCDPEYGCFYKPDPTLNLACDATASCASWVQFNAKCIVGWVCDKYSFKESISKHCTWQYRDCDDHNPETEDLCGASAGCVHRPHAPTPSTAGP